MTPSVVVGVDGSQSSWKAVETAAREARMRDAPLQLVHAFGRPDSHVPRGVPPWNPGGTGVRELVDGTMAEAEQLVRRVAPHVEVTRQVTLGEPLTVLEAASRTASLVVVGHRGLSTFRSLLLGSTAGHLAAHARCPVLIVRGRSAPDGPVLLAVDDAPSCHEAVRFAFTEASLRHADLLAIHVSGYAGDGPAGSALVTHARARPRAYAAQTLEAALAGPADRCPEVTVRRLPAVGHVRRTLIDASADAQLLVAGARGAGGFTGLLQGSVSQALLHHALCPVVVVRHEGTTEPAEPDV
jgi:nucleotide-binding universal stress UspA family protein